MTLFGHSLTTSNSRTRQNPAQKGHFGVGLGFLETKIGPQSGSKTAKKISEHSSLVFSKVGLPVVFPRGRLWMAVTHF